MLDTYRLTVGAFRTNCYVIVDNDKALIIDPGSGARRISEALDQLGIKRISAILLTHGHFDHIGAVDKLVEKYHCPVYASQDDEKMMRNEEYNNLNGLSASIKCKVNWLEKKYLFIDGFQVKVIYSPGHSNGSVMFVIDGKLYSGDTLFKMGVGRTDLYSGSEGKLSKSLKVLNELDNDMIVYPGHDEPTTIGFELKNNPYLG